MLPDGRQMWVCGDFCIGQSVNGGWFSLMFHGCDWYSCDGLPDRDSALKVAATCAGRVEQWATDGARFGTLALAH